ncbi:Eukaryotic translation initiation factor 3 subunit A [Ranunculus cassubicifolius]
MSTFTNPENALKRAEELEKVDQKAAALAALHDLITSKRYRGSWQKILERIMFKYVELCVDLRNGSLAKDGLIQYRYVCQSVNVGSLEEVIKHFLQLSSERVENAKSKVQALEDAALDVDDLEADKRPEDLMISYVSGKKGKDRSDREVVTPWLKFLWETYRTVLDILRNNSKLETLYSMTAHRAFQFCKQYKRTTEFRRLCEIIRNHLANLNKFKDQRDRPELSAPETLQLYLDTRFEQLKVATELALWQEAFRTVEDIHGLMCIVKKTPKASLMIVYYAKLTEIFWVADSHLYHAYAWFKIFTLQKSYNKNLTQKDLQLIASSIVLAALSVVPYDHSCGASYMDLENEKERNLRMANLIGFNIDHRRENREELSRSALLSELVTKGVISCASQEVKDLYNLLEHEFLPLDLASKVQPLLSKISKLGGKLSSASSVPDVQLAQYVPALEKLTTLRLLQQVSVVYQTMKISVLSKMIPFFDFSALEKIAVDATRYKFIAMKFNHLKGVVTFGTLDLESDRLRDHLTVLAESLNKARSLIYPPVKKASKLGISLSELTETVGKEHKTLLARKVLIEQRKEALERALLQKERLEAKIKLAVVEPPPYIPAPAPRRPEPVIPHEPDIEPNNRNRRPVIDRRVERERKLNKLAKNLDYFVRAKREEEAPLVREAFQRHLTEEQVLHEHEQQQEVELSKLRHAGDLQEKNRLAGMLDSKTIFQNRIESKRKAEYDRLMREREEKICEVVRIQKQERETKRKMMFYLKTEEERRRKLWEEEEARKMQEVERKKREEAERKAKLDEIAEKQRQREREIEEKAARQREIDLGRLPSANGESSSAAPPSPAPRAAAAYVPRHKRGPVAGSGNAPPPPQAAAADRWNKGDGRAPPPGDRWGKRDPPSSGSRTTTWSSPRGRPAPRA